jgi:hypothetical protein
VTLSGGCLCEAVRYEIVGEPLYADWCHCRNCRKSGGSAADPCLTVRAEDLTITEGTSEIRSYTPEGAATRTFCGICGSPTPSPTPGPLYHHVSMGTLDDDPGLRPVVHKGLAWRAAWDTWKLSESETHCFEELPTLGELQKRALFPRSDS